MYLLEYIPGADRCIFCEFCQTRKPATDFPKCGNTKRVEKMCFRCKKAVKIHGERRRRFIRRYKKRPCMDCGKSFPSRVMEYDHREPSLKLFSLGGNSYRYSLPVIMVEIAKCDIVCCLCHRLRTHSRIVAGERHTKTPARNLKEPSSYVGEKIVHRSIRTMVQELSYVVHEVAGRINLPPELQEKISEYLAKELLPVKPCELRLVKEEELLLEKMRGLPAERALRVAKQKRIAAKNKENMEKLREHILAAEKKAETERLALQKKAARRTKRQKEQSKKKDVSVETVRKALPKPKSKKEYAPLLPLGEWEAARKKMFDDAWLEEGSQQ